MNHIVLLGNGFDLAHGLKTSYMDFLTWYLKNIAESVENDQFYEDDIVKVAFEEKITLNSGFTQEISKPIFQKGSLSNSPKELFNNLKSKKYKSIFKSRFIAELFVSLGDSNWVDIEYQYFAWLKRFYKVHSDKTVKDISMLLDLNKSYLEIIKQLEMYLSTIDIDTEVKPITDIHSHFAKIKKGTNTLSIEKTLIVNFNYTNTVGKYFDNNDQVKFIQIHGKLNDDVNPIIFGYGDEADSLYDDMEKLNENEYLRFMKSFGYSKTSNYQDTIKFLKQGAFEVHIMGHSCGLSDRLLLKRIFEHQFCSKINIYYYETSPTDSDYINKYMDISRHFSRDKKEMMREKIRTKNQSFPLVSYKDMHP